MENEKQNETPMTPHFEQTNGKNGGIGPVVAIIVIIILLALGGLYYFTTGTEQIPSYESTEMSEENAVRQLETQSSSDVITDIEADIEATDLSEIDTILNDLDAELENI